MINLWQLWNDKIQDWASFCNFPVIVSRKINWFLGCFCINHSFLNNLGHDPGALQSVDQTVIIEYFGTCFRYLQQNGLFEVLQLLGVLGNLWKLLILVWWGWCESVRGRVVRCGRLRPATGLRVLRGWQWNLWRWPSDKKSTFMVSSGRKCGFAIRHVMNILNSMLYCNSVSPIFMKYWNPRLNTSRCKIGSNTGSSHSSTFSIRNEKPSFTQFSRWFMN